MSRCRECWTGVNPDENACPACGAALDGTKKRLIQPMAIGLLISGVGIFSLIAWQIRKPSDGAGERISGTAHAADSTPTNATSADDNARTPDRGATDSDEAEASVHHHWRLRDAEGHPVDALLVGRTANASTLFLPMGALPVEGDLMFDAAPQTIAVIHADPAVGYALLLGPRAPESITALEPSASRHLVIGSTLTPITPTGRRRQPVGVRRPADRGGRLTLDRDLPPDCVLLDTEGRAVALALGHQAALTFDAAMSWLGRQFGRPLSEVQAELRDTDPRWLLLEAHRSVERDRNSPAGIRRGLAAARRAAAIATDRETIETAQQLERRLTRMLVLVLAPIDSTAAITAAREGLATFPDHHDLAVDLVRLIASSGDDPDAAILGFEQLAAQSRAHSDKAIETVARGLIASTRRMISAGRIADAIKLLERAVRAMPGRTDLATAYADALRAAQPSNSQTIVIPYDPRTNAINTAVSVAGAQVNFVVDTGATVTTIPTAVAQSLGVLSPTNRKVRINTASGEAEGELVRVPWLEIGGVRITGGRGGFRAVVMDLPGKLTGRGLLGMNVLQRFRMQIDSANGRLVLEPHATQGSGQSRRRRERK